MDSLPVFVVWALALRFHKCLGWISCGGRHQFLYDLYGAVASQEAVFEAYDDGITLKPAVSTTSA